MKDLRINEAGNRRSLLELEKFKSCKAGLMRHDFLVQFRKSKQEECAERV